MTLPSDLSGASPAAQPNRQVILGDLNLSTTDEFGVEWTTEVLEGWGGPASTISPMKRPRAHGSWPGSRYLTPRSVSANGMVKAPTVDDLTYALERLQTACSLEPTKLTVVQPGRTLSAVVHRQGEVVPVIIDDRDATALWSIQVVAPDPLKYGDLITQWTNLPTQSGGLTYPITYPITYDATVTSGTIGISNPGTIASPIRLRIDGPCNGPIITHVSSGRSLVFASSYSLSAGAWLDIDMDARTVLENGQASRNGYVTSRGWFSLDPGDNTIGFNAVTYNSQARLTVYATPAWD